MRQRGFTLVEVLVVVVILGVTAIAVTRLQGNMFTGQTSVKNLQVQAGLLQECAEQVLGTRAWTTDGYVDGVTAANFATNCGGLASLSGYTLPTVAVGSDYSGGTCPTGATCKTVTFTISGVQPVTLMLANY